MLPHFTKENVSWEGHWSGAIAGLICAFIFLNYGPQRPEPIEDEEDELEEDTINDQPGASSIDDADSHPTPPSLGDEHSPR